MREGRGGYPDASGGTRCRGDARRLPLLPWPGSGRTHRGRMVCHCRSSARLRLLRPPELPGRDNFRHWSQSSCPHWIITIASPAWSSLQRGQEYELRLVFGSAPPRDRRATAIGIDGSITLWMTFIDTDVIVEFMEEPAVQIWSNKQLLRRTQLARQPERIPASDAMPGKNGRDHEECTSAAVSPGRKTRSASPIRERSLSHPRSRAVNPELVIISRLRSWVVPMNRVSREASEHIRTIVRLRLYGRDASAAIRRLELLRRALIPMRIQLEKLSLTEQDAKRPHKAMVVKLLSNTSKSRK